MSLTVTTAERVFTYNGTTLPDPAPGMPAEQVRDFYAQQYPDLATAAITGPETKDGKLTYTFTRAVGTKG